MTITPRQIRNATAIAGLLLMAGGCWFVSPPWAFIVVGAVLFGGAVLGMILGRNGP